MKLEILKERDTPLLSRKRVTFEVDFKGSTPTRLQIRDEVAKTLKADKELTVIKHIYNRYGIQQSKVIANVYTDKKDMERYEDKGLLEKHMTKKEEKVEAPAEKEAEEKSAEEKPAEKKPSEEKAAEKAE